MGKLNGKSGVPFKKGDPRINRKGRPRKLPDLDGLLREVLGEEKDGRLAMKLILQALRANAVKGDVRSAELLMDRAYGKQKQPSSLEFNIDKLNAEELDKIIERVFFKNTKK